MEKANRKLKSIYFRWAINYAGPPPRSFASTFEEHLENEYYQFDESWLQKILAECGIKNEEEFKNQVSFVEEDFNQYCDQQSKKLERQREKRFRAFCRQCELEGTLPF